MQLIPPLYPEAITQRVLSQWEHVSSEEVRQWIDSTSGFTVRLEEFRDHAPPEQVAVRQQKVSFLKHLLYARRYRMGTTAKKYPEQVTPDMLPKYAHIPSADVRRDIADTEYEILQYRALEAADRKIADNHPNQSERRLADFRAGARPLQIADRQAFVDFLKRLLAARGEA